MEWKEGRKEPRKRNLSSNANVFISKFVLLPSFSHSFHISYIQLFFFLPQANTLALLCPGGDEESSPLLPPEEKTSLSPDKDQRDEEGKDRLWAVIGQFID